MKLLTVLFYDDGRYAGTQGHERPLRDGWEPPCYLLPGEEAPRRFLAVHLGAGEMPGGDRCVSTDLAEALEHHPSSTPEAPRFGIKSMDLMPQIYDAPVALADFPRWMRANGPARMAKPLRAWLTLHEPELAATYRLNRGIDIDDMAAVERKRVLARPEHSLLPELELRSERRAAAKRGQVFARQREAERRRIETILDAGRRSLLRPPAKEA